MNESQKANAPAGEETPSAETYDKFNTHSIPQEEEKCD